MSEVTFADLARLAMAAPQRASMVHRHSDNEQGGRRHREHRPEPRRQGTRAGIVKAVKREW